MYVAGFIIPVPENKRDAYRAWAERSAALMAELGCIEIVESWEDNVPDGSQTDFRKAVAAEPDEKIVFTWQVWPDKATVDRAEQVMQDDPRFDLPGDIPFDPKRIVFGGFSPLLKMGR